MTLIKGMLRTRLASNYGYIGVRKSAVVGQNCGRLFNELQGVEASTEFTYRPVKYASRFVFDKRAICDRVDCSVGATPLSTSFSVWVGIGKFYNPGSAASTHLDPGGV